MVALLEARVGEDRNAGSEEAGKSFQDRRLPKFDDVGRGASLERQTKQAIREREDKRS